MDVLRIFDNNSLGSYYKFLVKYEKEYTIRLSEDEEKVIEFISKKLASGKRIHELEYPLSGNLIEMNRARTRNHSAAFRDIAADIVLVITAVTGQRNRNHKVIPVISDEIQYNDIFFVLSFTKSPAKLLDEHDR